MHLGRPSVRVPVLSNTTTRARPSCSMAAPLFTITPSSAARLTAAITATGVARISGQGVATTSIARTFVGLPLATQATAQTSSVSGVNQAA